MKKQMDDGYIKFQIERKQDEIDIDDQVFNEINFWRQKSLQHQWIGQYPEGIGFGNISCVMPDGGFLISGSATGGYSVLEKQHFALVNDYDIDKNYIHCVGNIAASSESLSHAALYENNNKVKRIIHIHDLHLWKKWANKIPTSDKSIEYGTPQMARELQKCQNLISKNYGVIIMGGHQEGIIAYGQSFTQVYDLLRALDSI